MSPQGHAILQTRACKGGGLERLSLDIVNNEA